MKIATAAIKWTAILVVGYIAGYYLLHPSELGIDPITVLGVLVILVWWDIRGEIASIKNDIGRIGSR